METLVVEHSGEDTLTGLCSQKLLQYGFSPETETPQLSTPPPGQKCAQDSPMQLGGSPVQAGRVPLRQISISSPCIWYPESQWKVAVPPGCRSVTLTSPWAGRGGKPQLRRYAARVKEEEEGFRLTTIPWCSANPLLLPGGKQAHCWGAR